MHELKRLIETYPMFLPHIDSIRLLSNIITIAIRLLIKSNIKKEKKKKKLKQIMESQEKIFIFVHCT